ncbi:MAG: oligosaccharide flippase family protein [Elusimicrobia bacterium]|nr:oligosaccharide flippase family protein [Elusimicrobiota bacterium]
MGPHSLRRNFSWTLAGSTIFALCQWGIVVVFAKLTSPEELGRFALGVAITGPAIIFTNLSLSGVLCTDTTHDFEFQDYLRLRLLGSGTALLGIAAFVACSRFAAETKWIILAIALAKGVESISDVYYGLLQQHQRMNRIGQSMILRGTIALAAVALTTALTRSALWGSCALAASWLGPLVFFDVPGASRFVSRKARPFDVRRIGRLAGLALPLGAVATLISLSANIPRYFILHAFGPRELGIFSALTYFSFAGTTAVNALGQSATPRLARTFTQLDKGPFLRLLGRLFGIVTVAGVVGVLGARYAGYPLLSLVYTPQYANQSGVLTWLMVATLVSYFVSVSGYAMMSTRQFYIQLPIFIFSTAATAAGCFYWVPRHGALGAAWAMTAAGLLSLPPMLGCVYYAVRKNRP